MQGTRVQPLLQEDSTSRVATEPALSSLCSVTREATAVRSLAPQLESGPHLPHLEKAHAQQQRSRAAQNKFFLKSKKFKLNHHT